MERRPRIAADSDIPFLNGIIEPYADVVYLKGKDMTRESIGEADALIIRTRTKCNRELLEGTNVKFIASATIGSDHADLDYCRSRGIFFTNAAGCNAWGVVQYVMTAIFCSFSKRDQNPQGLTLGIVGAGNVGERLAKTAELAGFRVLRCDPPVQSLLENDPAYFSIAAASLRGDGGKFRIDRSKLKAGDFCTLEQLLKESDIVSLHVPLNKETEGMAGNSFFESMKNGAMFINSSRGEVLNETALLKFRHKFASVVIDVWSGEPQICEDLLHSADIATPHIAGYSLQGKINATVMSVNSIGRFLGIEDLALYDMEYPVLRDPDFRPDKTGTWFSNMSGLFASHYDIEKDSTALKNSPGSFEELRENYAYRNEYSESVFELIEIINKREYV